MDFKSHARALAQFVKKYELFWREEIMDEYPETLDFYPSEWIELLETLNPDELYEVDCKRVPEKLKGTSFEQFMQEVKNLCNIEFIKDHELLPLEPWAFNGVKRKKEHEIQKIVPVLKELRDQKHFNYVVDIGGGVGHLSRVLSHYHSIPSISIDQNTEFQARGAERLKKFRKLDGAKDVTFKNLTFGKKEDEKELREVFSKDSLSLGLHTCGSLANKLIQNTIDHNCLGLLNFGCCYYRMDPKSDFPLSTFYKEQAFPTLNLYGLTLSTRSHAPMTRETYNTKERVKYYRYALHLFLLETFNNKYFRDVGECHISTYWKPFNVYIEDKLKELNLTTTLSSDDYNTFYNSQKTQDQLRKMYLCNIIRWQIGRVIETYIQIDRCLYLEENNYEVEFRQYFDEELSPRNYGILAIKKD